MAVDVLHGGAGQQSRAARLEQLEQLGIGDIERVDRHWTGPDLAGMHRLGGELDALHGNRRGDPRHGHGMRRQPSGIVEIAQVACRETPHPVHEDTHADAGGAVRVHAQRTPVAHCRGPGTLPRDADVDMLGALGRAHGKSGLGGRGQGEFEEVRLDRGERRCSDECPGHGRPP